ncbi:MAG TPA: DUF6491 family protein [Allosphingosinicella sp.]|jgi:hypothetical protein
MKFAAKALLAAAVVFSFPAGAAERSARVYGKPTQISFASRGGIQDWHADSDRSIYIMDRMGRWYYATLSAPCPGLRFQNQLGFDTGPLGEFDTWGSVLTRDQRCHVETLVTSPAPQAKGGPRVDR